MLPGFLASPSVRLRLETLLAVFLEPAVHMLLQASLPLGAEDMALRRSRFAHNFVLICGALCAPYEGEVTLGLNLVTSGALEGAAA